MGRDLKDALELNTKLEARVVEYQTENDDLLRAKKEAEK